MHMRNALLMLILIVNQPLLADTASFNHAYQDGGNTANALIPNTERTVKEFNPQNIFQSYTGNPTESQYYQGERQSTSDLTSRGAQEALIHPESQAVIQSFSEHPLYKINANEPGMQRSQLITNDAANIVNGISDQFVDCQKTQECHLDYTKDTCSESGGLSNAQCTKDLRINVIPAPPVVKTVTIEASGFAWSNITFTIDLRTGQLVSSNVRNANVKVAPHLDSIPCASLQVNYSVEPISRWSPKPVVQMNMLPSCNNHFQTTLTISSAREEFGFYFIKSAKISFQLIGKEADSITEQWTGNCEQLEQKTAQGICSRKGQEVCTSPASTHVINGVPIMRDCWQKTIQFDCQHHQTDHCCQGLRDKGCEQIGSTCTQKIGNDCLVYQQLYRCPKQTCSGGAGIICGDKTFCLEGNCTNPQKTQSRDFEKSIAALSATADASKQFDANFIFRGNALSCRKAALGFSNCCNESGWGQDIHLASCDDEEKALGHSREAKKTIYVGKKCTKHLPWPLDDVCIQYRDVYCSFGSKLARIVQTQGRQHQLRIAFGDGENPNCRGLTPEELQRIDFSRIDFTEFYDDIKQKLKISDQGITNDRIKDAIKRQYDQGKSHG